MDAYIAYLDGEIEQARGQMAALRAQSRDDEAAFAQIRFNIHDICRTVYGVCRKMAPGGQWHPLYLQKLDRLRESWEAARTQANAHEDDCRAVIEGIKLESLAANRTQYTALYDAGKLE